MDAAVHVTGNRLPVDDRVIPVERFSVSPESPESLALVRAGEVLRGGGLVAFPPDTFYGLAADPRNEGAVMRVYRVKGRAFGQPLPLIAANVEQVQAVAARLSPLTLRLAERFWPGPVTLIVDAQATLHASVHGGSGTVAVRVPDQAVARGLAAALGFPTVSTSANHSGDPAVRTAREVIDALGGEVDLVLDSGPTPGGEPSTIVDARGAEPRLVRSGAVPFRQILEAV
jgi:L-threonylcarbamoyladenylate synthase